MTERRDRLKRISLLVRENEGRRARPTFLADIAQALGESVAAVSLLSLNVTDDLDSEFTRQYQASARSPGKSFTRAFRAGAEVHLYRFLDCMAETLSDDDVAFITKQSEICGAVQLKAGSALAFARNLLALDGDSVVLLSLDGENGLLLDYIADDPDAAYELTVFGKAWLSAVAGCE